ncbi:transcription elongation regulator 1 [Anthonomus grandis grandis]|uniref:transcription elongation regulator 1 n=1 Tax=Anthonomus grandis grandis TaxID=2921223 RepID=UPI00216541CA|nr:transcription elongation regulator 1 [Anthonomus grandis grandis]
MSDDNMDGDAIDENFQEDAGFDDDSPSPNSEFPGGKRARAARGGFRWSSGPPGGPRDGPPRFRGRGGFGPPPGMFRGGRGGPPPFLRGGPPPRGFNGPPPNFGENWGGPGGPRGPPPNLMSGPPFGGGMMSGPSGGMSNGPTNEQTPPLLDPTAEIWVETKAGDGKSYFYNARTRETTWNKPEGGNIKIISQDQVEAMAQQVTSVTTQPQNTSTAAQAALAQASVTNKPEDQEDTSQKEPVSAAMSLTPTKQPNLSGMPNQGPPVGMMGPPPGMSFGPPPGGFPPFGHPPFGLPPPGQGPPGWLPPGGPWGLPPGLMQPPNIPSALPAINEAEILSKIDPNIIALAREWTEHKAPDGRMYYHHAQKGESVWDKPQALKDLENAKLAAAQGISTKPPGEEPPMLLKSTILAGLTDSSSGKTSSSQHQEANGAANSPKKEENAVVSAQQLQKDKEAEAKETLERLQEEIRRKKEEDEREKEKKAQDKSRPVSSTPVPGTPWCVVWTGDGRVFFYNPSSRTSVWERPDELLKRTDVDKMVSTAPEALAGIVKPDANDEKTDKTAPKQPRRNSEDSDSDAGTPAKKPKVDVDLTTDSNDAPASKPQDIGKEAAIEAEVRAAKERAVIPLDTRITLFKEMLAEKQVSAFSTWEKELHKIVFDSRYLLLTSKERKQVFEKYVKERAEEERREKRNKLREKKDAFKKLLTESHLHGKSSFSDFAQKYAKDERFKGVDKMRERESLFNEFLIEVRRKEKEEKFQKREAVRKDFIAMLREHSDIDRHTHWVDAKRKIDTDSRYKAVDSHLREDFFREYCKILKEEKRRRKEEREREKAKEKHKKKDKERERKEKREKDKDRESSSRTEENNKGEDEEEKRNVDVDDVGSDKEIENHHSEDEKAKEDKEKERQAKAEASLKRREEEVQRTLATHMRDRDKEREQHKRDEARQHFNALLVDLVRNSDLSWKEVKRILRKDHRWDLADSLSREEKEKLFNDHVDALLKKKRQSFREMLDETTEMSLVSSWKEIKKLIRDDPRYTKFASSERCEREFKDYIKDKMITAKGQFKELLQETKLITHKSLSLLRENQNHMQEIEDILKNDKRFLVLDHIPDERTQLIITYLEDLDRRGPPPPPTASEPNRRVK